MSELRHDVDKCVCHTCERQIGHMGIASHRAMHRRKKEDCDITYNDGRRCDHFFGSGQYHKWPSEGATNE
jgi:hypothetical protein